MKNHLSGFYTIILSLTLLCSLNAVAAKDLDIRELTLNYPSPGTPFYHFRALVDLPEASIIEVEAAVNGKVLRFTDLHRGSEHMEEDKPPLSHRPPSGYGLSVDHTLYKDLTIIGWVPWQPGDTYNIKITVRMKKEAQHSSSDVLLTATKSIKAPAEVEVFDPAWKNYKSVVLSETAGIDRTDEPVEVLLAFYPDEAQHLTREIRVVAIDAETHKPTEIASQVYDIMKYDVEDDTAPDQNGAPARPPLWLPTVTARVAFLANVPAKTSRVFLIYYNNEDALAKSYKTDLHVQGEAPGLYIENKYMSVVLHPNSGHLDQITMKSAPDFPLFHRMETNGAVHWNPGIYIPPRPWTHTADWKPPANVRNVPGPVITKTEVWDQLREIPEVDASVRYEFFPGMPYFISATSMRINETVHCIALRNAEIVFKRELMTHAAWPDVIRDKIITYDVVDMPDLTDLKMEADVPWITFYNEETGVGFAGIQLSYANAGLESEPRLLNPFMYITGGPWIYWARALSLSFLSSNMQQMIPALKGNFFSERWAYLVYDIKDGEDPYKPILDWQKRLLNPLRIQLVEEVDDRVSKTVHEIFIDEGKSGWEQRETGRHGH